MWNVSVAAAPFASVAVQVTVTEAAACGVPDSTRVIGSKDRPLGRFVDSLYVNGAVPPVAASSVRLVIAVPAM